MLPLRPNPVLFPPRMAAPELTPMQREILKRSHLPDKIIADEMNISYYTVTTHTQNIRRRTGLRDKKEMVYYAIKTGFIE